MPIITINDPVLQLTIQPPSAAYGPLNLTIQDISVGLSAGYTIVELSIPGTSPITLNVQAPPVLTLQLDVGQGPSGVIGSAYASIVDEVSSSIIYRAEAVAGTLQSAALWRIQKITISGSVTTVTWASGTANFDKIWNDRLSYTYS